MRKLRSKFRTSIFFEVFRLMNSFVVMKMFVYNFFGGCTSKLDYFCGNFMSFYKVKVLFEGMLKY